MGDGDVPLKSNKGPEGVFLGNIDELVRDAPDLSGCYIPWEEIVAGCDLSYLIPKKDAPQPQPQPDAPPGLSRKLPPSLGKSYNYTNDKQDGVKSYTTIMGFCEENFGLLVTDSWVSQSSSKGVTGHPRADQVIQITPFVGMVGSGNQHVLLEVADQIDKLKFEKDKKANAATVKDVVVWVVRIINNSIELKKKDPKVTDYRVSYILIGKTGNKCEMYTINNDFDSDCVVYNRCTSRFVNGGSGEKPLTDYQRDYRLDPYVSPSDAVSYCFSCMQDALLKDRRSGGDIKMLLIDDICKPILFPQSGVYGHYLQIPENRSHN